MADVTIEHDRLYVAATELLKRDGVPFLTPPISLGWFARRRVRKGVALLEQVVGLNPGNWAALWVMGKAFQALDQHERALECFCRSKLINADHPDIAREAGISAMECGRPELAIEMTRAALTLNPADPGLQANLALAHLFAGEPKAARVLLDASLQSDPEDRVTQTIARIVDEVLAGS